ncbi:MAG: flagellar type III secretion system pore protein FliP [Planctomycetota bacterium]
MRQDVFARPIRLFLLLGVLCLFAAPAAAQQAPTAPDWTQQFPESIDDVPPGDDAERAVDRSLDVPAGAVATPSGGFQLPDLSDRDNLAPALQMIVLLTVLSLAPALLVMCTSFTRIIIVLSLLRQALGTQSLPPNQVLTGLALFMTFLIMAPTWQRVNSEALQPYLAGEVTQQEAMDDGLIPIREFMIAQIQAAENDQTVLMFQEYAGEPVPETWGDVGTLTLIPAYVLSELKVGFLMGFKVYLPFLVIDMVIAAVLISMGMMMLPPVLISLPFKLLLFVLVDGWFLIVGSLMESFRLAQGSGATAAANAAAGTG